MNKKTTPATEIPKEILVFACDYEADGTPILAAVKGMKDIPDDCKNQKVGSYTLNHVWTFKVKRELQ